MILATTITNDLRILPNHEFFFKVVNHNIYTFEQSKNYAQKHKIKSKKEWYEFVKTKKFKKNIPRSPSRVYSSEWKGWGDFLGTGLKRGQNYKHIFKKEVL